MLPSEIIILPGRFRPIDKIHVKDLKKSMADNGLIQPVVVNEANELVAGLHRLTAALELGWADIATVQFNNLSHRQQRIIELEENIRRKAMGWLEIESARVEIHRLRQEEDPNWTQNQTAASINESPAAVSEAMTITRAVKLFPEIAKADTKKQALSLAKAKLTMVNRVIDVKMRPKDYRSIEERILLGDAVDLIKAIPDESFKIILTDPPFGIDYDKQNIGRESALSSYKDDEESYERLLTMAPDMYRVLQPNGWLTWFFAADWFEVCKKVFLDSGFIVDPLPVVWDRRAGRCFTTRPDRYYTRSYDLALHCFKGEPQIVKQNRPNILSFDPISVDDRDLTVERPIELYEELLDRLTIAGEPVLDPFCGSGSCLAAAARRRQPFLGFELSEARRAVAIKKVAANMPREVK